MDSLQFSSVDELNQYLINNHHTEVETKMKDGNDFDLHALNVILRVLGKIENIMTVVTAIKLIQSVHK